MTYIVFDTQEQVCEANQRYKTARANAGIHDTRNGVPVEPEITTCWDMGREMLDGRFACQVPDLFYTEFVGGIGVELELTDEDFPEELEVM